MSHLLLKLLRSGIQKDKYVNIILISVYFIYITLSIFQTVLLSILHYQVFLSWGESHYKSGTMDSSLGSATTEVYILSWVSYTLYLYL